MSKGGRKKSTFQIVSEIFTKLSSVMHFVVLVCHEKLEYIEIMSFNVAKRFSGEENFC